MAYLELLLILAAAAAVVTQDCQSEKYNFKTHVNSGSKLELGMEEGVEVGRFAVTNTRSATASNEYLEVAVENDQLVFTVKKKFEEYEKNEHGLKFVMTIQFHCNSGTISGTYYQDVLEVNKYTPEFSLAVYEATVPLPLPKNFDLTPYLDDSKGITAFDFDLSRNTVEFKIPSNDYLMVESQAVEGNVKQFRAILRLKEQILKLPGDLELELEGTDQGDPPKTGRARVVIKPDLTIEYNDPPMFKKTLFEEDYNSEVGNSFVIELIPGTSHEEIQFGLVGDDAEYFALSVESDKTRATVSLDNGLKPAKGKYFFRVVVQAKRTELQTAECVILVDLKVPSGVDSVTTVEKVLSTVHLEERRIHEQVFPLKVGECSYEILSQTPNKSENIFSVDDSTGWIVSSQFNREDPELFAGVEEPQFHLVLRLRCPKTSNKNNLEYGLDIEDIPYSTDITHLRIVVGDINDNSPMFQYPKRTDRVFAFPVQFIAERLMINSLMQVIATDLDAGLNAEIRYSLDSNENFDIHPKNGIIYPLKNYFRDENPVELMIFATDCDGSEEGNISRMMIRVVPAMMYQIMVLQPEGVTKETLEEYVQMLEMTSGFRVVVLGEMTTESQNETISTDVILTVAAVAFNNAGVLLSTSDFTSALNDYMNNYVSPLNDLLKCDLHSEDDCSVYPYVVVMSVFIVLFIAALALIAYFYFKLRQYTGPEGSNQTEPSVHSEEILVDNPVLGTFSTPPAEKRDISGSSVDCSTSISSSLKDINGFNFADSSDSMSRRNRLVRNLSSLVIIDESEESSKSDSVPEHSGDLQRRKSIRFNEEVERIETFS